MVPDIQKGIQSFWKIKNIPTIRYCLLYSVYCTVVLRGFNSTLLERPNKKLNYLWFQWIDYYENITIHVDEEENIFFFFKKGWWLFVQGTTIPSMVQFKTPPSCVTASWMEDTTRILRPSVRYTTTWVA